MDMNDLQNLAVEVDNKYQKLGIKNGYKERSPIFYIGCLMGDLGDLSKLVLAKEKYRGIDGDLDDKLIHELCDCLWVVLVLAKKLNIDLEASFPKAMAEISNRIDTAVS